MKNNLRLVVNNLDKKKFNENHFFEINNQLYGKINNQLFPEKSKVKNQPELEKRLKNFDKLLYVL